MTFPLRTHPDARCDFCSGKPTLVIRAEGLVSDEGPVGLVLSPDWASCDACYALFDARDFEALAERCMKSMPWTWLIPAAHRAGLRAMLVNMHTAARDGVSSVEPLRPDTLAR